MLVCFRFVEEYKKDPKRDYGERVVNVFARLNMEGYEDPYRPAREQFDKQGSFGNGAAMRVAPVALYFCHNLENCLEVAKEQARLTHFNWIAILGAVLQVTFLVFLFFFFFSFRPFMCKGRA